jgi:KDEL-tailed cysteine endopeptidase
MQYVLLLLAFISVSVSASSLRGLVEEPGNVWSEFTKFQKKFDKFYQSVDELEYRLSVFRENLHFVVTHNMLPGQNFTLGINQFADLTEAEFREQFSRPLQVGSYGCKSYSSGASSAPASIDWRQKGAVTSVKDQQQCGSCWTFATSACAEGAWAISTGKLIDLSEQELVDCATGISYGSHGCNGGQPDGAFKYLIQNGQCSYNSYPYVSGTTKTGGTCQKCTAVAQFSSCSDVTANDQISLKGAVAQQPVSIAIEADTKYFQLYSSGVLTDAAKCGQNLDHAVLIVGYGTDNGNKYWNVKNSWGTSWGENGYVRIGRSESTNDAGVCGIAMMASFISV